MTNQGNAAAQASWSDGIYLSNTNVLDGSATYVGSFSAGANSPLAAGASYRAKPTSHDPQHGRRQSFPVDCRGSVPESGRKQRSQQHAGAAHSTGPGRFGGRQRFGAGRRQLRRYDQRELDGHERGFDRRQSTLERPDLSFLQQHARRQHGHAAGDRFRSGPGAAGHRGELFAIRPSHAALECRDHAGFVLCVRRGRRIEPSLGNQRDEQRRQPGDHAGLCRLCPTSCRPISSFRRAA